MDTAMPTLLTEQLDGWWEDYGAKPIRQSLLSKADRVAMAVAALLVRLVVRAINLGFRMVERYEK